MGVNYTREKILCNRAQNLVEDIFHTIEVETITKCNRKCKYCPNCYFDRGDHLMSESLFMKIIGDLSFVGWSGRFSPHFYGEPLLDKRILQLIYYAKLRLGHAIYISLFTNGDFLAPGLVHQLFAVGVDKIKATNHSGGTINKKLKQLLDPDRFVYDDEVFRVLRNRGGLLEKKIENITSEDLCYGHGGAIVVNYKGDVVLCCDDYHGSVVLGNVGEENIIDIWNKPRYLEIRRSLRCKEYKFDICQKCSGNGIKT